MRYKKLILTLIISLIISISIISILYFTASVNAFNKNSSTRVSEVASSVLKDYDLMFIGESDNEWFNSLWRELKTYNISISEFKDLEDILAKPEKLRTNAIGVLIFFSGDYLDKNLNNTKFINSLRMIHELCGEGRCFYVAVGGKTSRLFDVLDKAGIYSVYQPTSKGFTYVNPAYFNPRAAGLHLKVCAYESKKWIVPEVFGSNASSIEGLIEGLANWLLKDKESPCVIK
jgi:hypothetical protein